jgi:acyl-CoA reductase-like NAD-dependent aldehyde dehydrogenase
MPIDTLHQHLIAGARVGSSSDEAIDVLDPATEECLGRIPAGTAADADAAVSAARAAQARWARTPATERAAAVKDAAARLRRRADEIAELQTRENGKPLDDSRGGVMAGIETLEQYAELGPLHRGRSLVGGWTAADMMVHEPRGVAVVLVPWNDPVAIACGLLGAALVTGNTVVYKPSEKTPLSGIVLAEAFEVPGGVLNLVLGDERAGRPLVAHADVDLVMHTGSVATGREVGEACARSFKKAILELGGKDPMIVDAGVDPRWAAEQAATGAWANAGQICTSIERIYVHEAVAEPFVDELVRLARERRVAPGTEPEAEMGPLIDARRREAVHGQVQAAAQAGASVLAGGEIPDGPGFFYPPTVVTEVPADSELMRQETFGPVAAVRVVPSFEAALEAADGTEYGLAACVLTASQEHAQQAWRALRVGTVKVNAVFGGAPGGAAEPHKASGMHFGYGPELLDEVTVTKVVHYEPAVEG